MSREIRLPAGTEYLKLNEVPELMAWALCPYDTNDNDVFADIQYRITKDECKKIMVDSLVSGELVASHPVTPTPAREIFTDGFRPDDELLDEFLDLCRISIARLTKFCASDDWNIKVIVDSAHDEQQAEAVGGNGAGSPAEKKRAKNDPLRDEDYQAFEEEIGREKIDNMKTPEIIRKLKERNSTLWSTSKYNAWHSTQKVIPNKTPGVRPRSEKAK